MRKIFTLLYLASIFIFPQKGTSEKTSFIFDYYDLSAEAKTKLPSKSRIAELQEEIKTLEKLKKKHQKNDLRHTKTARQCAEKRELFLESRREYELAEYEKDKIRVLERKLKQLEEEKAHLETFIYEK